MIQARLYERVSTDEQAATGFSLAAQHDALVAFCASQGWRIAGRYVDDGYSAKNLDRPAFQRMIAESQAGDVILIHKLDRLTRSVRDLDDLLRLFDKRGLLFRSATQQFNTTDASGRLFIRLVAEFAQFERESIAERSSMGKAKRARSGEWPGGQVPFGYVAVPGDQTKNGRTLKRLEVDELRAHVVPMIFEKYLAGFGTRAIALWLNNELMVKSWNGGTFSSTAVSHMLKNPTYCGDVVYGRFLKGPMERIPGKHQALISRDLYEQVQKTFAIRQRYAPRHATGVFPLSGIARCGVCGGKIYGFTQTIRGSRYRTYACDDFRKGRYNGKHYRTASADVVEANFIRQFEVIVTDEFDRFINDANTQSAEKYATSVEEVERLRSELDDAKTAVAQWDAKYEKKRLTEEEHEEKTRPHIDRIREITMRLIEVEASLPKKHDVDAVRTVFVDFIDSWNGLSLEERKSLVQNLVELTPIDVLIHPERQVEIRPRVDVQPTGERL